MVCPKSGILVWAHLSLTQSRLASPSTCHATVRPALHQGSKIRKAGIQRDPPKLQPDLLPCHNLEQLCCHLQGHEWHNQLLRPHPGVSHFRAKNWRCLFAEVLNRKVPRKGSFTGFPSCDPTCHRCERTLHSSKQINNSFPTLTWRLTLPINSLISCCWQGSQLPCGCLSTGAWSRAILFN